MVCGGVGRPGCDEAVAAVDGVLGHPGLTHADQEEKGGANGTVLSHVKPHGSLYLTAVESEETALAVAEAIARVNRPLIFVTLAGQKGGIMARAGREFGLAVAHEAFPDRAYTPEGTLAPRQSAGR